MTKWVAKINENDDYFGEEILMGITGGEYGFEVILSTGEDSGVLPAYTEEEALEAMEDYYNCYDTFAMLPEEP